MNPNRPACVRCEALLGEYRDGTLPVAEAAEVRRHLAACADCASLHTAIGVALEQLRALPAAVPPPHLVSSILARTLPPVVQARPGAKFRGFSSFRALLVSPRFGLGFAMALFASALVLNAAQINLRRVFQPGWSRTASIDRVPDALLSAGDRQVSRVWARAVSYYHDLRVVYEIEAAINQARQSQSSSPSAPETIRRTPVLPGSPNPSGKSIGTGDYAS